MLTRWRLMGVPGPLGVYGSASSPRPPYQVSRQVPPTGMG